MQFWFTTWLKLMFLSVCSCGYDSQCCFVFTLGMTLLLLEHGSNVKYVFGCRSLPIIWKKRLFNGEKHSCFIYLFNSTKVCCLFNPLLSTMSQLERMSDTTVTWRSNQIAWLSDILHIRLLFWWNILCAQCLTAVLLKYTDWTIRFGCWSWYIIDLYSISLCVVMELQKSKPHQPCDLIWFLRETITCSEIVTIICVLFAHIICNTYVCSFVQIFAANCNQHLFE